MGKLRPGAGIDDFICPADIVFCITGQWGVAYKNTVAAHRVSERESLGWCMEYFPLVGNDLVPDRLEIGFYGTSPPIVFLLSHWFDTKVNQ